MSKKADQARLLRLAKQGKCSLSRLLLATVQWPDSMSAELKKLVLARAEYDDLLFYLGYWMHSLGRDFWDRLLELTFAESGTGRSERIEMTTAVWFNHCPQIAKTGDAIRWPELECLLLSMGSSADIRRYLDALRRVSGDRWEEGEVHVLCEAL